MSYIPKYSFLATHTCILIQIAPSIDIHLNRIQISISLSFYPDIYPRLIFIKHIYDIYLSRHQKIPSSIQTTHQQGPHLFRHRHPYSYIQHWTQHSSTQTTIILHILTSVYVCIQTFQQLDISAFIHLSHCLYNFHLHIHLF